MNRVTTTTWVIRAALCATISAIMAFSGAWQSTVTAQDITITIKQGDDKPTIPSKAPFTGKRPAVDVAILLDTSNSMDGLISQAKSQLWQIIQQFGNAEKAGLTPRLRVAVFEYGNSRLSASDSYIRQVVSLTDDLDKVSEALFGLKTSGGDEYCGAVINEALSRLDWSSQPNAYKAIFIAGNEPFTQGSVSYETACSKAIGQGVVVNTIHCGDYNVGVTGKWKHGAELAEGEYLNINQDRVVVHIKAPQDKIIIELNQKLNKTYLWYGDKLQRSSYFSNQLMQDSNAFSGGGRGGGGFAPSRIATKASSLYSNRGRDLVDSMEGDSTVLASLDISKLPEAMQKMTPEQRADHVKEMTKKRSEIKKKIITATEERKRYVDSIRVTNSANSNGKPGEATLGDAVSDVIQKQLKKSGFGQKKK